MALEQKAIGRRIASLREQKGWSQEDAAHEIGVTVRTYQRWEAGATSLRMRNLNQLAEAFEVEPVEIIGEPTSDRLEALATEVHGLRADLAWLRADREAAEARSQELRSEPQAPDEQRPAANSS